MKGFIEIHDAKNGNKARLVNIDHIVEVNENFIYTDDDTPHFYIQCTESYDKIKVKIGYATKE